MILIATTTFDRLLKATYWWKYWSVELIPFLLRYWYSSLEADVLKNDSFTSLIYGKVMTHDARFALPTSHSPGFLWWIDVRQTGATKGWDGSSRGHILHLYIYMTRYARSYFSLVVSCCFVVTMFLVFIYSVKKYIWIYMCIYLVDICSLHLFSSSFAVAGYRHWWVELRRTGVRVAQHRSLWVAACDLSGNVSVMIIYAWLAWMSRQKYLYMLF